MTPIPTESQRDVLNAPITISPDSPTNPPQEAFKADPKFSKAGVKLRKHKKHIRYGVSDTSLSQGFSDESVNKKKSIENEDVFFSNIPRRHTVEYSPIQEVHFDETNSNASKNNKIKEGGKYKLSVENTANVKLSIVVQIDGQGVSKNIDKLLQSTKASSPKHSLTGKNRTNGVYQIPVEKEIIEQIDSLKKPKKSSSSKIIDFRPNLRITDFDTKGSISTRCSIDSRKSRETHFDPCPKLHFKIDKESRKSPPKLMSIKPNKLTMDWASAGLQLTRATIREVPLMPKSIDAHPGATRYPKQKQDFVTGSSYQGYWNSLGFSGFGTYTFVHGAVYNGNFKNGEFHGYGTIVYPNGVKVKGQWKNGKLASQKIVLDNGLEIAAPWTYCEMSDRRFQIEHSLGLNGADEEYLSNKQPTVEIPENCYDGTDGFYDPEMQCIYKYPQQTVAYSESDEFGSKAQRREILRIPLRKEIERIVQNHRRAEPMPAVGYRPDLYEEWTTGEIFEELAEDRESDDSFRSDDSSMENVEVEVELLRTK